MDNDSKAILKFVICIAIIAVLLIVWFNTVGAPASDEEEIILKSNDLSGAIASKISGFFV
ncbi:MAG: hypothetical protein IJ248_01915 [Candidatus Methanomethylophilaceae archaeon]|nr:hypothetical protein [Candidatus Methanomethylophilaceae archaeon]